MKSRMLALMTASVLSAVVASPGRLSAQNRPAITQPRYSVFTFASLGGTTSGASSINNRDWVSGVSNLPGNQTQHAALWAYGRTFDLGTLGGPKSGIEWPVHNNHGKIVGIAETATVNPLGEIWSCGYFFPTFTNHNCEGFVWQDGTMTALPTLGGYNSYAAGMNNHDQIVGWAENPVHDPTCNPPQVLQFEAVIWGPSPGQIQQLPPLPGDVDSAATAINDQGQVVGISGICSNAVGGLSAKHAVLWENGIPTDIGNLGGISWNTPTAINDRGQVVGFSDLTGDDPAHPNYEAFLWTKAGGIQNLGVLSGDTISVAYGVNHRGQIVGASGSRAFLWQNGLMVDLNSLIQSNTLSLVYANDINDRGEIVGQAYDKSTGQSLAFVATPRDDDRAASSVGSR